MKESWRKQMQQKMEGYEQPAPEMAWDDIEQAVNAGKSKPKPIQIWSRRVAAAILAGLIAVAGYRAFENEEEPLVAQQKSSQIETVSSKTEGVSIAEKRNPAAEEHGQSEPPTPQEGSTTTQLVPASRTDNRHKLLAATKKVSDATTEESVSTTKESVSTTEESVVATEESVVASEESIAVNTTATSSASEEKEKTGHQPPSRQQTQTPAEMDYSPTIYPSDLHKTTQHDSRLMAKVYLSNAFGNDGMGLASEREFANLPYDDTPHPPYGGQEGEFFPIDIHNGDNEKPDDGNNEKTDNKQSETTNAGDITRATHHQPIRLGLSLRYRLNDKWSLESGLTYTRLVSDIAYSTNLTSISKEQTLHYIGIPLQVNYQIWNNRHFDLYASMGGMVEKMVSGRQTSTTSTEHVSISPLQWSLGGSLGAAYKLSNLFSIYAEPGLNYYFNNGSSIPTLYQEKPFNFSISLGLRIHFK